MILPHRKVPINPDILQPFFYVRREKRYEQVRFEDIIYIKAKKGYIQIVCEQRTLLVMNTLTEITKFLPPELFTRIHHSYIVALWRVREFDRTYVELYEAPEDKPYKLGLAQITRLPVGQIGYRNNFRKSVKILKNKSGSNTATKRRAAFELEGEEIEIELNGHKAQ
jgi:hypothetical protein